MMNFDDNMKLFKDANAKNLEGVSALAQLGLQAWNQLAVKQMEILSLATDAGVESLTVLSKTQDVQQLTAEQTQISTAFGEKLSVKNQELAAITSNARDEFNALAQEQVSQFNAKLSQVSPNV